MKTCNLTCSRSAQKSLFKCHLHFGRVGPPPCQKGSDLLRIGCIKSTGNLIFPLGKCHWLGAVEVIAAETKRLALSKVIVNHRSMIAYDYFKCLNHCSLEAFNHKHSQMLSAVWKEYISQQQNYSLISKGPIMSHFRRIKYGNVLSTI